MSSTAPTLRDRLYTVIFLHDTRAGKAFDVALLVAVLLSVLAVVLESVEAVRVGYGDALHAVEWVITWAFVVEYALRVYCAPGRLRYAVSFFGLVDLVSILPAFLGLIMPGAQSLQVVRVLRLVRVFRVLKLGHLGGEADSLLLALRASVPKITVFVGSVLTLVVVAGASMYLVEGPAHGFTNIPTGMYWAIVTLTTVGYGDLAPHTPMGKALASLLMILGYGVIAVPTGIVSAEMVRGRREPTLHQCTACGVREDRSDAAFCRACGARFPAR